MEEAVACLGQVEVLVVNVWLVGNVLVTPGVVKLACKNVKVRLTVRVCIACEVCLWLVVYCDCDVVLE